MKYLLKLLISLCKIGLYIGYFMSYVLLLVVLLFATIFLYIRYKLSPKHDQKVFIEHIHFFGWGVKVIERVFNKLIFNDKN